MFQYIQSCSNSDISSLVQTLNKIEHIGTRLLHTLLQHVMKPAKLAAFHNICMVYVNSPSPRDRGLFWPTAVLTSRTNLRPHSFLSNMQISTHFGWCGNDYNDNKRMWAGKLPVCVFEVINISYVPLGILHIHTFSNKNILSSFLRPVYNNLNSQALLQGTLKEKTMFLLVALIPDKM